MDNNVNQGGQAAPQSVQAPAQNAAPQADSQMQPMFNTAGNAPVGNAPASAKKKKEITNEKLYRAIIFNRILTLITIFLMVIFIAVAGVIFYRVNVLINEIQPVIDLIETIDLEGINKVLVELEDIFGEVDWEKTADALNKFDVDAVNEMVSAFDINKLNTAIDNINSAYKTMEDISAKLQPVLNFFGGGR
ncbi:MAG: hypothetical protein K5659_06770 [Lachnospiraceae bacterium]|nr:hypothetical protein [Lachnospiraceae bacterium]